MKILFICNEYPPGQSGGIGSFVHSLAHELHRIGHQVYVAGLYSFEYGGQDELNDRGVKVWRMRYGINAGSAKLLYRIIRKMPGFVKRRVYTKKSFGRFTDFIRQLVTREGIQIIEMPDWNDFGFTSHHAVRWPVFQVPVVLKLHGSHSYFASELGTPESRILAISDKALFETANAVSSVSKYTAEKTQSVFGIKRNIRVLYNGITIRATVKGPKQQHRVIFSGSLAPKKGIQDLLAAWNNVHRQMPAAKLIVCGKGDTVKYKNMLEPGVRESVTFRGHLAKADLQHELDIAVIGCFPSHSETFGLAAIEAMEAGNAVIFMKKMPGPEIVTDQITGLLVEPGNVAEITSALLKLLGNEALRATLSNNARREAERRFNIENCAREHIGFYTEVINNFRPGSLQ
jgi:glycosyltransferase involved in cell wall biosynthesis